MTRIFLFTLAIIMISGAANAEKRYVEVTTEPKGVKAKIYKVDKNFDFEYLDKCKTPCTLKFKSSETEGFDYYITFNKKDYVSERDIKLNLSEGILKAHQVLLTQETAFANSRAKETIEREANRLRVLEEQERKKEWENSKIENCRNKILTATAFNRDPTPCRRLPPEMPFSFRKHDYSGYCKVEFDILLSGETTNIRTTCTDPSLESAAIGSVEGWIYLPKRLNGQNVISVDVKSKVHFITLDERGHENPLRPGFE